VIQFAPATLNPELVGWLEARGYRGGRNWVKLWHDLEALPRRRRRSASSASTRRRHVRVDRDRGVRPPPEASVIASAVVGRPGWSHFLAYDGDAAVSAAAMFVTGGRRLAGVRGDPGGGAAAAASRRCSPPACARRGTGCRWAITETGEETPEEPVNHSYRNMLRAGFRLAYARQNWVRIPRCGRSVRSPSARWRRSG
jgi:hypothetical protein